MTRKRPPQIPVIMPSRRRRQLSEDELTLWEHVARQVKPLRRKKLVVKRAVAEVTPEVKTPKPPRSAFAVMIGAAPTAAKAPSAPPLVPIARRERSQLSRGKREIDARIDLHGLTQSRAHRALLNFLERASDEGFTYVLVITGKGRTMSPDSEQRGILKRQVPEWLSLPEFRPLVIGFEEANIAHGGSGALYVRVRRTRR